MIPQAIKRAGLGLPDRQWSMWWASASYASGLFIWIVAGTFIGFTAGSLIGLALTLSLIILARPLARLMIRWRLSRARKNRDKLKALIEKRWEQWSATPPFVPLTRQVIERAIEQLLKPKLVRAEARVSELETKLASL